MINNSSSTGRKYQFFEEVKDQLNEKVEEDSKKMK